MEHLTLNLGRLQVDLNIRHYEDEHHHHHHYDEWTMSLGKLRLSFRKGIVLKMNQTLPDNDVLPFVAPTAGVDAAGNPTTLTGTVAITVSDPTIATIVQPDPATPTVPNSGLIVPTGPLGTVQVTFTDTTDAASPLIAIATITVVASATVSLANPTFGPVRAKTDPLSAHKPGAAPARKP